MDLCLQCGLPIPPQVALQGESRFCCAQHRADFRLAQERVHLLQIPEPGAEWDLPPEAYGDSTQLAPLMLESCPILRIPLHPHTGQLQPIARKYEFEPQCASSTLPAPTLAPLTRLASLRPRPAQGRRLATVTPTPQPGRQDRLSRYAFVLSLMRLNHELQPTFGFVRPQRPSLAKQQPAPAYRKLRGFPVFAVADGDPALSGYLDNQVNTWARSLAFPMRLEFLPASIFPLQPEPVAPCSRIAATNPLPEAARVQLPDPVTDSAESRLHAFDAFPIVYKPASPRHIPKLREPWDLTSGFLPSLDPIQGITESLLATRFQLRDRRSGFGLHVPQTLMAPLRPRLLISNTDAGSEPGANRQPGVVSILSLRAALGSRR